MPDAAQASGGPAPVSFAGTNKGSDSESDEGKNLTATGLPMPIFATPEKCGACKICAWLCPHFAITVYEAAAPAEATR